MSPFRGGAEVVRRAVLMGVRWPSPPQCVFMPFDGSPDVLAAAIERLRETVRQVLKCVINLHIDILVMEANVTQLITEARRINADIMETKRLDELITLLKDFDGPPECHEWPYPILVETAIDKADIAFLNVNNN